MRNILKLIYQHGLICSWLLARIVAIARSSRRVMPDKLLIIPGDAQTLIGSRGDEAMLVAASRVARAKKSVKEYLVACEFSAAERNAACLGMRAISVWGRLSMPFRFLRTIKLERPGTALIMGADMMDGYYSPITSLRMVIAADLLARSGARTSFLGFSWNEDPAPIMRIAFRFLHRSVRVNLRDDISLQRFMNFTSMPAKLVADTAFLLEPAELSGQDSEIAGWVGEQRNAGRRCIAVNFHPMLFTKERVNQDLPRLIEKFSSLINSYARASGESLSWLLMPHDDREEAGDMRAMAALYACLSEEARATALLVNVPPRADSIKKILSNVDGVVTGRMHMAIAALGSGVPVMALAYQGKFAGLMQHFDQPTWLVRDPASVLVDSALTDSVQRFLDELPRLTTQVRKYLPGVKAAAMATFDF